MCNKHIHLANKGLKFSLQEADQGTTDFSVTEKLSSNNRSTSILRKKNNVLGDFGSNLIG